MGRKGVSKRKPTKTKSGPVSITGNNSANSFSARVAENLPIQGPERNKAIPPTRGGIKPSSKH
jgi:hypothetical protein